jgi:hypothetical protein
MSLWKVSDNKIEQQKAGIDKVFLDIGEEMRKYSSIKDMNVNSLISRIIGILNRSFEVRGIYRLSRTRDLLNRRILLLDREIVIAQELVRSCKKLFKITNAVGSVTASKNQIKIQNNAYARYLRAKIRLEMLIQFRKELREIYNIPR